MSKKVTQNVTNSNSEDLTEQWKKGEIYKGTYYCKSKLDGHQCIAGFVSNKGLFDCDYNGTLHKDWWEVLAEVPSYEEWFNQGDYVAFLEENNKNLKEELQNQAFILKSRESEITKLKELLKECELWFTGIVGNMNDKNVGEHNRNLPIGNFEYIFKEFSQKINQVLGEE